VNDGLSQRQTRDVWKIIFITLVFEMALEEACRFFAGVQATSAKFGLYMLQ